MKSLEKKVAVITGAAHGIGASCAEIFASRGASVVLADLPDSGGEELAERIRNADGRAHFIACDVSNPGDVEALMAKTVDQFGALHIGVNNAGIGGEMNPTGDYSIEGWQKVLDVNLTGVFLCMKFQIPHMLKAGGGSIINVASILGQVGFAHAPAYTAAKHGVVGLTRAAAQEYGPQKIRINAIGPAFIDTPMISDLKADKEVFAGIVDSHPIGRIGQPEEVAHFAAFLASDDASFITGSYLPVDGGYLSR